MANVDFEDQRANLIDRLDRRLGLSDAVDSAMRAVPREEFVPESRRSDAYADRPLPIGEGQTISAPHMVAIMVEELDLERGDSVLEIGTGCGYHAAVTAEVVGGEQVSSVEFVDRLGRESRERLARLGYGDVSVRIGDGRNGWAEQAPFDAVYVTCATDAFPERVVDQVRVGGHLLAPIGNRTQWLVRARKRPDGSIDRERLSRVRFVRMQGPE